MVALYHVAGVDSSLALRKEVGETDEIIGSTKATEILEDKAELLAHGFLLSLPII